MVEIGQLYTYATWRVKEGKEAEFIQAWQAFADWTSGSQPGADEGVLLQREEDPREFVSLGPWEGPDSVVNWRAQPRFQAFIAKARELCEDLQPQNMKLVGHSSPHHR